MKTFIYSGSKSIDSVSNNFMNILSNKLSNENNEVIFRTPKESPLLESEGAGVETTTYKLLSNIKDEMLSSDIIIFCSPVYLHNISGSAKIFLDNLVDWSHTMRLAGKLGVIISVSESNGNSYVNSYLKKIFNYMGLTIISDIQVMTSSIAIKDMSEYLDKLASKIVHIVNSSFKYGVDIEKQQELIFSKYKQMYKNKENFSTKEREAMDIMGFNDFLNFTDLFNSFKKEANKNGEK